MERERCGSTMRQILTYEARGFAPTQVRIMAIYLCDACLHRVAAPLPR